LKSQVEAFKTYMGYYPELVYVDKTYRHRDNCAWYKERGIRVSGLPLGRPPKDVSKEKKKQGLKDERIRNCIEGKFGQAKRRFSLGTVMAKLSHTSLTTIPISFVVMNLSTLLLGLFCVFLWRFFRNTSFFTSFTNENYVLDNRSPKELTFLECFFPQIAVSRLLLDI
jgi:hypothetical protein